MMLFSPTLIRDQIYTVSCCFHRTNYIVGVNPFWYLVRSSIYIAILNKSI